MENNRIKALRAKHGLTLMQLSKEVGIRNNTISQYETGVTKYGKAETWQRLADYFNVSVDYLKGYDEIKATSKRINKLVRLKECRLSKKLTLQQLHNSLAKRGVNISVGILSKYEIGNRIPREDNLLALADFFEASTGYLQGYYYSIDYLFKTLAKAYNDQSNDLNDRARDEIKRCCLAIGVKVPEKIDVTFLQDYFMFVNDYTAIKKLANSTDSYSDSELTEILLDTIELDRLKKVVNAFKASIR